MPCGMARKGGGGVRKTEINMEFKKQENVWISYMKEENGEVGILIIEQEKGSV